MTKLKVVVMLVRQLRHGFTKKAKVYHNVTVAHLETREHCPILNLSKSYNTNCVFNFPFANPFCGLC